MLGCVLTALRRRPNDMCRRMLPMSNCMMSHITYKKFSSVSTPLWRSVRHQCECRFRCRCALLHEEQSKLFGHTFCKTYSSSFFDMNRQSARQNSSVDNRPTPFGYFEAGMTWHFKDFEEEGKTKLVLYKKSYKGNKWAARVPLHASIPCKVRKIYGGRIGALFGTARWMWLARWLWMVRPMQTWPICPMMLISLVTFTRVGFMPDRA